MREHMHLFAFAFRYCTIINTVLYMNGVKRKQVEEPSVVR